MISRALAVLALVLGAVTLIAAPASAGCEVVHEEQMVNGVVRLYWVKHCDPTGEGSAASASFDAVRDSDWDTACVRTALSVGWDPLEFCYAPSNEPASPPTISPGLVASALQRLPLPAASLVVQPPNGRTLVNFETNFYTEQGEFTRTVRLLGRQVELRIWPERFGWEFGDGHEKWTTSPGDAYPHLEITHRYLEKGRVAPSVSTLYAAQFRVGNGPWRDVAGTVTVPGDAQSLRVVEARPVLVGGS